MAFTYGPVYKENVRVCVKLIKTTPQEKNTPEGKLIRKLKEECLELLENVSIPYRPYSDNHNFYITESTFGFNKKNLSRIEKLNEIKVFLNKYIVKKQM